MPTRAQIIAALTERGKIAITRSLTCAHPKKHARYRQEASGYAELCRLMTENRESKK